MSKICQITGKKAMIGNNVSLQGVPRKIRDRSKEYLSRQYKY